MIKELLDKGDKEGALRWIDAALEESPDNDGPMFYFATLMMHSEHPGVSKYIFEHLAKEHPQKWQVWINLSQALSEFGLYDRAEAALKKAEKFAPDKSVTLQPMCNIYTQRQEWAKVLAMTSESDNLQMKINRAFALLATDEYGKGWDLYEQGVGHMIWRDKHSYGLKDWNGERGKVIFYAEQGIGDQIAFCSALPDAIRDDVVAAVNCHPKVYNLFRDSFDVPVYGDQFKNELEWPKNIGATHQAPMCSLQRHYRREKKHYNGRPFLKANEGKAFQWRALFESISDKPKIGIAWNGGMRGSFSWKTKSVPLEYFRPLIDAIDAEWISMEYVDKSQEIKESGLQIHDFPWGTQTPDYSDTVAMVSALDAVVCVPTAVYHAAGGIGVPCWVLMQDTPHFHERTQYYESVRLYKRSGLSLLKLSREILDEVQRCDPGRSGASGIVEQSNAQRANGGAIEYRAV